MLSLVVPSLFLIISIIDDLKTRKVHNKLILAMLATALAYKLLLVGSDGLLDGLLGLVVGVAVTLPLVLARAMGAGDMKVLAVLGLATDWPTALWTAIYSLIWGALLGIFQALLQREGLALLKNTAKLLSKEERGEVQDKLHRIPYTVALFLGWLTHVSLSLAGGNL